MTTEPPIVCVCGGVSHNHRSTADTHNGQLFSPPPTHHHTFESSWDLPFHMAQFHMAQAKLM